MNMSKIIKSLLLIKWITNRMLECFYVGYLLILMLEPIGLYIKMWMFKKLKIVF